MLGYVVLQKSMLGVLLICLNCLKKAVELGLKTVAFPSISTGAYHFPVNMAANIAVKTVLDFLKQDDTLEEVSLICLDQRTTLVYDMCLAQLQR